jgi:hypothetical protein
VIKPDTKVEIASLTGSTVKVVMEVMRTGLMTMFTTADSNPAVTPTSRAKTMR